MWSIGIVLVALLAGAIPWDAALPTSPEFRAWRDPELRRDLLLMGMWKRIATKSLGGLRAFRPAAALCVLLMLMCR